jgi:hypothetical protein
LVVVDIVADDLHAGNGERRDVTPQHIEMAVERRVGLQMHPGFQHRLAAPLRGQARLDGADDLVVSQRKRGDIRAIEIIEHERVGHGSFTIPYRFVSTPPSMTRHQLLSPSDFRRMAWKNGTGRTTEIDVHPPRAALDAFDWRISVADVARSGPFSRFAGIDRTIVVIAGAGMRLLGTGHTVILQAPTSPIRSAATSSSIAN